MPLRRLGHLVARHRAAAERLGWRMAFHDATIAAFGARADRAGGTDDDGDGDGEAEEEEEAAALGDGGIDIAVALHACDTATDEARFFWSARPSGGGGRVLFATKDAVFGWSAARSSGGGGSCLWRRRSSVWREIIERGEICRVSV